MSGVGLTMKDAAISYSRLRDYKLLTVATLIWGRCADCLVKPFWPKVFRRTSGLPVDLVCEGLGFVLNVQEEIPPLLWNTCTYTTLALFLQHKTKTNRLSLHSLLDYWIIKHRDILITVSPISPEAENTTGLPQQAGEQLSLGHIY